MSKLLLRTNAAIESCKLHLQESDSWNTEIESFLTQHILVMMCADVQQEIYKILEKRVGYSGDNEVKDFALASGKKILRSIGKSEVVGFVGNFGEGAKAYLNSHVDEREITLYNNAVKNRHDVAHKSGSNITFKELEEIVTAATNFIKVVENSISPQRDNVA